jgi:HSP20 family protein
MKESVMTVPELHERTGRLLSEMFGDATKRLGAAWRPAADVEETPEAYLVEIELPGVRSEDISVEFGANELMVTGEIKQKERVGLLRKQTRPVGRFEYRVVLPAEIDPDHVGATLSDGVLKVRVPKSEVARPRSIPIGG